MKPFKPLHDRVVVKPIPPEARASGLMLSVDLDKEVSGEVLAVGPGGASASGALITPQVKVGDIVVYDQTAARVITWDGEKVHLVVERQLIGTR